MTKRIREGLARQEVLDTKISGIENSNTHIRGYSLSDLLANSTFEETTYLLLHEELPTSQEYSLFLNKFAKMRGGIPDILHKQMNVFKVCSNTLRVSLFCQCGKRSFWSVATNLG